MREVLTFGITALVVAGCSGMGNPSPSSKSVKKGELGNGAFTFRCDDSVACDSYRNADTFPEAVALGSTFELGFLLRDDSAGSSFLKDAARGTTIEPVGRFVNRGPSGFAAVNPGVVSLSARDQKGALVDYVTVRVARPDSLVVYDAELGTTTPERITSLVLEVGDRRSLRTLAQEKQRPLAGMLPTEWTSRAPGVVTVDGYVGGKVTLLARGRGTTILTIVGGGFTQELAVEVKETGASAPDAGADAAADGGGA